MEAKKIFDNFFMPISPPLKLPEKKSVRATSIKDTLPLERAPLNH